MLMYQTRPSESARLLRDALHIRRIGAELDRVTSRRLVRNGNRPILNWGNSTLPPWAERAGGWINRPETVAVAISKFRTLETLKNHDVPAVEVTRDEAVAREWATQGRCLRRRDGLSGGLGIREVTLVGGDALERGEFYSRIFPKTHEFRVHVFREQAIDFTEKKARQGVQSNRLIRSHENGWVFAHENLSVTPEDREALEELAIEAVVALDLDFGAVDLLATLDRQTPRRLKKARVCEINTAPGLENSRTVEAYINALREVG